MIAVYCLIIFSGKDRHRYSREQAESRNLKQRINRTPESRTCWLGFCTPLARFRVAQQRSPTIALKLAKKIHHLNFNLYQFMKQPRPKLMPQRAQDMIPYYAAYRNLIWEFYLDFISCKTEDRRGHRWFAREAVAREQRKNYVDSHSVTRALQSHAAKKILSLCHSNICRSSC